MRKYIPQMIFIVCWFLAWCWFSWFLSQLDKSKPQTKQFTECTVTVITKDNRNETFVGTLK